MRFGIFYEHQLPRPWAQNALLTVDRGARRLTVTPAYWVFRHVAAFVEPGATVLDVGEADALAWKNPDGSIVAVLHNPGAQAVETALTSRKDIFDDRLTLDLVRRF